MAYSEKITESTFKVGLLDALSMNNMLSAHQVVSGTMFSIAIIAAIARTVIRFRIQRRLLLDDILLGFGCVCLIAATILLYKVLPVLYLVLRLVSDPSSVRLPPGFSQQASFYQKILYSHLALAWSVIYSVKFCFLCLFRLLIDRLKGIVRYWRFVVGITAISAGYCISYQFIVCPRFGFASACELHLVSFKYVWIILLIPNSAMCSRD